MALVFSDHYRARLRSESLDLFHGGPIHYFVLGGRAPAIAAAHEELLRCGGRYVPRSADRFFERCDGAFRLRDELFFSSTPCICNEPTRVVFGRADTNRAFGLAVEQHRVRQLGELLGNVRCFTAARRLLEHPCAQIAEMSRELLRRGLLQTVPRRQVTQPTNCSVTLEGHASLRVDTPLVRVLFDPVVLFRQRPGYFANAIFERPIDAIAISHCHYDHFHLESLLHLDKTARVILPAQRSPRGVMNLDMKRLVEELGFTDVVELDVGATVRVGDCEITAMPFFGEPYGPQAPLDRMTFRVETAGKRFMALVDTVRDDFGDMEAVCREYGPTDAIFGPCTRASKSLVDWCRRPFFVDVDSYEPHTAGPLDLARWGRITKTPLIVPYAAFDFGPVSTGLRRVDRRRPIIEHLADSREVERHLPAFPDGPRVDLRIGGALGWSSDRPMRPVVHEHEPSIQSAS